MPYPWIDDYLLQKPGVTKDLQPDWNWIRYQIGGKLFRRRLPGRSGPAVLHHPEARPAEGDFLRGQYADILPGYYMNKTHWNSVRAQGSVPDDLLRNLLDEAYRLVLHALPKRNTGRSQANKEKHELLRKKHRGYRRVSVKQLILRMA